MSQEIGVFEQHPAERNLSTLLLHLHAVTVIVAMSINDFVGMPLAGTSFTP